MNLKTPVSILYLLITSGIFAFGQQNVVYKQVDTLQLSMQVIQPVSTTASSDRPALVFFFGGGWNTGSIKQFEPHARYFSERGMVCFLVDYRVKTRHQTTPFESLKDAKSAIRYIREHSKKWQVDPLRIVAAGGSAGGHLAAATAFVTAFNESTDKEEISCVPNALVLFNPVVDNGPGGYGFERIGSSYKEFSPLHTIQQNAPPTLIMSGTNDRLIPVVTLQYFQLVMQKVKSRCDLILYEGQEHGFFNFKNTEYYTKTIVATDLFIQSLGYISSMNLEVNSNP